VLGVLASTLTDYEQNKIVNSFSMLDIMEEIEKAALIAQDLIDATNAGKPEIHKMMHIVKTFIEHNKVMCYGGTAINNLLSKKNQFYDPKKDIPDYDFFSETPQKHATELADNLFKAGIESVEVKPGVHLGTFKVFANYTGVADISSLDKEVFHKLWVESIIKDSIHYVPPNFLRMSVYLELSRPMGDVSRWKKIYNRLLKLNTEYPIVCPTSDKGDSKLIDYDLRKKIETLLLRDEVVLLGYNASALQQESHEWSLPLDILCVPEKAEHVAKDFVNVFGPGHIHTHSFEEYAELLPAHYDITNGKTLLVRVFETSACHSYHELSSGLRIASIPTLLNFFFAMLYADKEFVEHTSRQRLVCTAHTLVQLMSGSKKRRFKLLTPLTCLGKQKDLLDMKKERADLYSKLSKDRQSKAFFKYFFSYTPTKSR